MREVKHPMIDGFTDEFLHVYAGEDGAGGAPHKYIVKDGSGNELLSINLQHGNPSEVGINGVGNQTLLLIVIDFLQKVQSGDFKCRENAVSLTKLEEALQWSRQREFERKMRNVYQTHQK